MFSFLVINCRVLRFFFGCFSSFRSDAAPEMDGCCFFFFNNKLLRRIRVRVYVCVCFFPLFILSTFVCYIFFFINYLILIQIFIWISVLLFFRCTTAVRQGYFCIVRLCQSLSFLLCVVTRVRPPQKWSIFIACSLLLAVGRSFCLKRGGFFFCLLLWKFRLFLFGVWSFCFRVGLNKFFFLLFLHHLECSTINSIWMPDVLILFD